MKTPKRPVRSNRASDQAQLAAAIHALGDYAHVTVAAHRGALYVHADEEPVARLTPIASDTYGLSFHQHTGRWESTPFTGDLAELARVLVAEFGAYLAPYAFSPKTSGSDH